MQDYGRAVIIGEQTFGKGTVQQHKGLARAYDLYDNPLGSVQYTFQILQTYFRTFRAFY